MSLIYDITTSLEANRGPVFSKHKYDVGSLIREVSVKTGIWLCLQWNVMMTQWHRFIWCEAACPLSAVVQQQCRVGSSAVLTWTSSCVALQRKLFPVTSDIHPCSRFKDVFISAPHVCNFAFFSLTRVKQCWPTSQESKDKNPVNKEVLTERNGVLQDKKRCCHKCKRASRVLLTELVQ